MSLYDFLWGWRMFSMVGRIVLNVLGLEGPEEFLQFFSFASAPIPVPLQVGICKWSLTSWQNTGLPESNHTIGLILCQCQEFHKSGIL